MTNVNSSFGSLVEHESFAPGTNPSFSSLLQGRNHSFPSCQTSMGRFALPTNNYLNYNSAPTAEGLDNTLLMPAPNSNDKYPTILQSQLLATQAAATSGSNLLCMYPPSLVSQHSFSTNPFSVPFSSIYASQQTSASLHAAAQSLQQSFLLGQNLQNTNSCNTNNYENINNNNNEGQMSPFHTNPASAYNTNFPNNITCNTISLTNLTNYANSKTTNSTDTPAQVSYKQPLGDGSESNPSTFSEQPEKPSHQKNTKKATAKTKSKRPFSSTTTTTTTTTTECASAEKDFEGKWGERFEELRQYAEAHGDCLVPDGYTQNPKLARWVREQRSQYKNLQQGKPSHMTPGRVDSLNELQFAWSLRETVDWKDRFDELCLYKNKFGDCLVPTHYDINTQLGTWVANQRKHYRLSKQGKRSMMTPERISLLESIGFKWVVRSKKSK